MAQWSLCTGFVTDDRLIYIFIYYTIIKIVMLIIYFLSDAICIIEGSRLVMSFPAVKEVGIWSTASVEVWAL